MDKTYTSREVIEVAIKSKTKGVDLYLDLARNSENYHVGRLFMEMAKDEQRHKHELERLLETASADASEAYPGERGLYLKALVDSHAYNCDSSLKQVLETTVSEEEALQAGITFEKDFMLFLHELRLHVDEAGAKIVDILIAEEIKHFGEIFKLKDDLEKGMVK